MDAPSLMEEGINLMLFGMGFVFVFLTLLVIVTSIMSRIIIRIEKNVGEMPEDGVPSPTTFISPHHEHVDHSDDKTIVAVLSAAVKKYRSRK